jgi:CubicO group peptidase (beta-lactamase class C family)
MALLSQNTHKHIRTLTHKMSNPDNAAAAAQQDTADTAPQADKANVATPAAASLKLRIDFPPVKEKEELLSNQRASVNPEEIREDIEHDIPPVIRSVLELSHLMMSGHSQWLRASPGYQGGLFHKGKPFCFASGYRDSLRPLDVEDKGNHMKLKDPLVYGTLSLPITAAYLCELHGREVFDLRKPIVEYLPELHGKLSEEVTARSILSFTHGVEDADLLKDAGARLWKPYASPFICAATQTCVYEPINRFLAGSTRTFGTAAASLTGQQQRANFVQYIRSSPRITRNFRRSLRRAHISHCSVALLLAAVETQLKGRSFEEDIRIGFFEKAESHGTGYGAPTLWKNPNELFYQPTGQALQHARFKQPIPVGSPLNCCPVIFNGSLNLYAPCEDYGKLLLLSLDTIMDAREILGIPPEAAGGSSSLPYYDFGVQYFPSKKEMRLTQSMLSPIGSLPAAASFHFSCEHDLGCFGIASCGTRGARVFANNLSRAIQHLFVKHVLDKGVDPQKKVDLDNPAQQVENPDNKVQTLLDKQKFTSYFKKFDAHKRF